MASVVVAVVEWAVQRDDATRRNNFAIFIAQLSRWLSRLWLSSVWLPSGRLKPPAPCPLSPSLPLALEARQIKPLSAGEFAVRVRYFRCSQAAGCRHGWAAYLAVCLTICLPLFPSLPSPSLALSVSVCLCLPLHLLSLSKQRARRLCNCLPSGSLSQLATQSTSHALTHSLTHSSSHSLLFTLSFTHSNWQVMPSQIAGEQTMKILMNII